jgi:hypothetical protein
MKAFGRFVNISGFRDKNPNGSMEEKIRPDHVWYFVCPSFPIGSGSFQ